MIVLDDCLDLVMTPGYLGLVDGRRDEMAIKGGCLCGAVAYELTGEPMFVGHCACENCQKAGGGGHSDHR